MLESRILTGIDLFVSIIIKKMIGYILQKNGAHRTIAAKMFNAPVMSGIVTTYEEDEKKKKLYEDYESLKEILRLTDLKGMTLDFFEEKKKSQKKIPKFLN